MVCTPVAGTPYVIAATTYLDEFHGPVQQMESRVKQETEKTQLYILVILGGTLLLIGIIVSVYSHVTKLENLLKPYLVCRTAFDFLSNACAGDDSHRNLILSVED